MIPVTHPTFTNPFNGFGDCKISYLSSVSGLVAWTDYIPVRTVTASSSIEGRTEANGYQNVHPVGATGNVAWTDYIPVYEDATKTVPWSTDANGYIPVGMSEDGVLGFLSQADFLAELEYTAVPDVSNGETATFTRATTKTVENNDGYQVTLLAGEIGFPGARRVRNILTATEDLNNAAWFPAGVTVAASGTVVSSNLPTLFKITEVAAAATPRILHSTIFQVVGRTYIQSVHAKAGERTQVRIVAEGSAGTAAFFDLSSGVVVSFGASTVATIEDKGSGVYRCAIKYVATTSTSSTYYATASGGAVIASGDNTKGLYIGGDQLEDVTAQTTQIAGEYVSVGIESAPYYHGSMVDGVRCFPTDLAGATLTTMTRYKPEPAATNLCLQSQTIATAPWTLGNGIAVTADQYIAPDGTTAVDKLTALAGNTQHFWYQPLTTTAGVTTYSVYLRYVNNQWARIGIYDGAASYYAAFDILNGVVGSTFGPVTATAIEPMTDGVTWRVSLTATVGASALSQVYLSVVDADDPTFNMWNAAGTEAMGAWGAQVELGSFATSYIPTTTVAVTRNADILTYTGGNIPNLDAAGWAYAVVTTDDSSTVASSAIMVGHHANDGYPMYISSGTGKLSLYDETAVRGFGTPSRPIITPTKMATTWEGATSAGAISGNVVSGSFDGTLGIGTTLGIGSSSTGLVQLNGHIGPVAFGLRRLSDSELQAITR